MEAARAEGAAGILRSQGASGIWSPPNLDLGFGAAPRRARGGFAPRNWGVFPKSSFLATAAGLRRQLGRFAFRSTPRRHRGILGKSSARARPLRLADDCERSHRERNKTYQKSDESLDKNQRDATVSLDSPEI
ncbi:uncharacterized protein LOC134562979 isoform X4 [Prinia subflava]|uniref:uncharacterized protein LOC134562979 isoform X4 n=1 Tax=Prinia subflava TaxID=208062 RepID=UPI002FE142EB